MICINYQFKDQRLKKSLLDQACFLFLQSKKLKKVKKVRKISHISIQYFMMSVLFGFYLFLFKKWDINNLDFLIYIIFGFMVITFSCGLLILYIYIKAMRLCSLKESGELILSDEGIEDKNDEMNFKMSWEDYQNCIITTKLIMFLSKNSNSIIYIPYEKEHAILIADELKERKDTLIII